MFSERRWRSVTSKGTRLSLGRVVKLLFTHAPVQTKGTKQSRGDTYVGREGDDVVYMFGGGREVFGGNVSLGTVRVLVVPGGNVVVTVSSF